MRICIVFPLTIIVTSFFGSCSTAFGGVRGNSYFAIFKGDRNYPVTDAGLMSFKTDGDLVLGDAQSEAVYPYTETDVILFSTWSGGLADSNVVESFDGFSIFFGLVMLGKYEVTVDGERALLFRFVGLRIGPAPD